MLETAGEGIGALVGEGRRRGMEMVGSEAEDDDGPAEIGWETFWGGADADADLEM